jgi:hypothetical protein
LAEATLERATDIECPGDGQVEPFDGLDFLAFCQCGERAAGQDRVAIGQYGTRATVAFVATLLGSRELHLVAKHLKQGPVCGCEDFVVFAVDAQSVDSVGHGFSLAKAS